MAWRDKEAQREYQRGWRKANPARIADYVSKHRPKALVGMRQHYAENRGAYREKELLRKYGISRAEYGAMLYAQDGRCAICREEGDGQKELAVDHCHETGKVRGLLCSPCNHAIGLLRDDPELLHRAINYLTRP